MPRTPGTTDLQREFFRALRQPAGPKPDQWPSPAILRKWLRRPRFRRALQSVRDAILFQSDWDLTAIARFATSQVVTTAYPSSPPPPASHTPPTSAAEKSPDNSPDQEESPDNSLASLKRLESLLRIAHARQRFLSLDSRHTTVQSLTAELAKSQAEVATLRTQLADAEQKLLLSVPLDPYATDDPDDDQPQPPEVSDRSPSH